MALYTQVLDDGSIAQDRVKLTPLTPSLAQGRWVECSVPPHDPNKFEAVATLPVASDATTVVYTLQALPERVPATVSKFQAKAALSMTGRLAAVEAIMASSDTPEMYKLAWNDAQEFRRSSPVLLVLASLLGLSETDLDALFIAAAKIEA